MSFETPGDGIRCDHCNRHKTEATPLYANRGERLCFRCLEADFQATINAPVGWAQVPAHHYITPRR